MFHQGPSGAAHIGREALAAALTAFCAAYAEEVAWELDVVMLRGDEAEVRIREVATIRPRAGGPSLRVAGWHQGRLRREADGVWYIARDVSTLDGPPEPAEHDPTRGGG